jgi:anti-anti-sigma factor
MEGNIKYIGKVAVVKLDKHLDVFVSIETEENILKIINEGSKYILFDMSDVLYISSSGLRIFISAMRKLRTIDGVLKVSGMRKNVKKVFETVELIDLIELYDTIEDALNSFKETQIIQ